MLSFKRIYFLKNSNFSKKVLRSLRILTPQNVTEPRTVPDRIMKPTYVSDYELYEKENHKKYKGSLSREEMHKFREACSLARNILEEVGSMVREGVTTDYLDEIAHDLCIKNNSYPAPLMYKGFPKSICTSVNNVACHGIPDDRCLKAGDIINIDVTVFKDGFYGDTSHTYLVPFNVKQSHEDNTENLINVNNNLDNGTRNSESVTYMDPNKFLEIGQACRDEAIKACRPGRKLNVIGYIISEITRDFGLKVIPDICGHGISSFFHGPPTIYHIENDLQEVMRDGMYFTIEPAICEGAGELELLDDGWTLVTTDGGSSCQFEHTIVITRTGCDVLTKC